MIMKRIYLFSATILCNLMTLNAQTFLNGSFENTTSTGCDYNMTNDDFNAKMQKVYGYGAANELDIQITGCYIPSVPNGLKVISLNARASNSGVDAVAMELSAPLVSGQTYTISFQALGSIEFSTVLATINIGCSLTGNNLAPPTIYTPTLSAGEWKLFTFSFVAPNNGKYITIIPQSNAAAASAWTNFDAFTITPGLSTTESENSQSVKIYPNPVQDYLNVSGLKKSENYSIINAAGQKVMKGTVSENEKIDAQKLSSGLYFLLLENGSKIKFLKK